jgi:recombinational DNA repair protein RecR
MNRYIQAVVRNLILAVAEATEGGHTAHFIYHVEAVVLKLDTVRC